MKDGKQTTEYNLTKWIGIVAGLIIIVAPALASYGIITAELAAALAGVAMLAAGGQSAVYTAGRAKEKSSEAIGSAIKEANNVQNALNDLTNMVPPAKKAKAPR